MRIFAMLFLALIINFGSAAALAQKTDSTSTAVARGEVSFAKGSLNGTVKLDACSGAVIRFKEQLPFETAYMLTNGHCIGAHPRPGAALYNLNIDKHFTVFNESHKVIRIHAIQLTYATMTKTDIAIYRLHDSIESLLAKKVKVFTLSDQNVKVGDQLKVTSGYWRQQWSCEVEEIIFRLKESPWTFHNSLAFGGSHCRMIDGASGSPLISTVTDEVVGVWNTWNETGRQCQGNDPCEIDRAGNIEVHRLRRYGQSTAEIYSCLNIRNEIDLRQPNCCLQKPY